MIIRPYPTFAPSGAAPLPKDVQWMRWGVRVLLGLSVACFLAAGLLALAKRPFFAIQTLNVSGDTGHINIALLRSQIVPRLSGNFFTLDLRGTQSVFDELPWVRQAVVQRRWPSEVSVQLEEHRAVAYWRVFDETRGTDQLVNRQGELFEVNLGDVEDEKLPTLIGPEGSSALVLEMYHALNGLIDDADMKVQRLSWSARGSWTMTLDAGAVVQIGRGSKAEVLQRVKQFLQAASTMERRYKRPLEFADLRHPQGFALRLRGVSTQSVVAAAPEGGSQPTAP